MSSALMAVDGIMDTLEKNVEGWEKAGKARADSRLEKYEGEKRKTLDAELKSGLMLPKQIWICAF